MDAQQIQPLSCTNRPKMASFMDKAYAESGVRRPHDSLPVTSVTFPDDAAERGTGSFGFPYE